MQTTDKIKIRKELIADHRYRISWNNNTQDHITNYTVFWCSSRNDLPNNCDGSIDFKYIDSKKKHFERQTVSTSNFAIAANYFNNSQASSMVWAECTIANTNGTYRFFCLFKSFHRIFLDIGKVPFVWVSGIKPKSIILEWKLNCVDDGVVKYYHINYCRVVSKINVKCLEDWETVKKNATDLKKFILINLRSYQWYKIKITMISQTRQGPDSNFLFVETLESGKI